MNPRERRRRRMANRAARERARRRGRRPGRAAPRPIVKPPGFLPGARYPNRKLMGRQAFGLAPAIVPTSDTE